MLAAVMTIRPSTRLFCKHQHRNNLSKKESRLMH